MITLIYGEDTAASRNYYLAERTKHPEKIILDGASLTLTDFLQATSNNGLFGDQQALFIEELLSKRKSSKELDSLIAQITQTAQTPIFLWESKDLTAKQLSPFKGATTKQFKIPATVFAFLDALFPKNGKKAITLFHQLLQDEDVNFALFMLQRQVRLLLALQPQSVIPAQAGAASEKLVPAGQIHPSTKLREELDPGSESRMTFVISEVKRMAPWQKGKMQKQAKAFSQQELLNLHEQLYQLDLGQKTGGLSMPLEQEIDFLLLSM
jgi:DNA polymerase III delta subunit